MISIEYFGGCVEVYYGYFNNSNYYYNLFKECLEFKLKSYVEIDGLVYTSMYGKVDYDLDKLYANITINGENIHNEELSVRELYDFYVLRERKLKLQKIKSKIL